MSYLIIPFWILRHFAYFFGQGYLNFKFGKLSFYYRRMQLKPHNLEKKKKEHSKSFTI